MTDLQVIAVVIITLASLMAIVVIARYPRSSGGIDLSGSEGIRRYYPRDCDCCTGTRYTYYRGPANRMPQMKEGCGAFSQEEVYVPAEGKGEDE